MLHRGMLSYGWCGGSLGPSTQAPLLPCQPWEVPPIPAHTRATMLSALRGGLGVSGLGRKHCSYLAAGHQILDSQG